MAFNEVFDPRNIENANIADFTGSTGIVIFLGDKNIYIANAGNSRCLVINKEGMLINKTKDHTINDPEEKKRVELARSFNEEEEKKKEEDGVKTEYLDSTRGFGDWEFKGNEWIDQKDQEVSVEPEILEVPIKEVQYLIMGSHGMFESGKDNESDDTVNNQVCTFFMDEIKKNGDKPYSKIIEEYFEKIIPEKNDGNNIKGLDNMSCIVISLNNEPISQYIDQKEKEEKERKKREEEEKKRKKEEEKKRRLEQEKEMDKQRKEERRREEDEKRKAEGKPPREDKKEEEDEDKVKEGHVLPNKEKGQTLDKYSWGQMDIMEISINVPLTKEIRSKDMDIVYDDKHLKVGIKGKEPIINGELFGAIDSESLIWTIDENNKGEKNLIITFEKREQTWWESIIKGDKVKVDTGKISPEASNLSDIKDPELKAQVEKMMFDTRQKQMGKPTSDILQKCPQIEDFMKAHPEMDFSHAKFG